MTNARQPGFQRARNAEQREVRRDAILDVARELLVQFPVREISLRELSRRVGLSKTNVVRYFETREAIFFALLNLLIEEWLEGLPMELPSPGATPAEIMYALARSVARRPAICELWSSLGAELETNISAAEVRAFKLAHADRQKALAELLRERLILSEFAQARELVQLLILLIAGLWPFANPSPSVQEALKDPALAGSRIKFADHLGRLLLIAVTGILHAPSGAPARTERSGGAQDR